VKLSLFHASPFPLEYTLVELLMLPEAKRHISPDCNPKLIVKLRGFARKSFPGTFAHSLPCLTIDSSMCSFEFDEGLM
jgi:hypothetical protein